LAKMTDADATKQAILTEALAAYDAGIALRDSNPDTAALKFKQSLEAYERLLAAGVVNADLFYNIANAYARLGDWGDAVLHYRRAARLTPRDADIAHNLRFARGQVAARPPPPANPLWQQLAFWRPWTTPTEQFWIAAVTGVAGWSLVLVGWLRRHGAVIFAGVAVAILAAPIGISLYLQLLSEARTPPVVVIADAAVLRSGPGHDYEPVFAAPLSAGVEARQEAAHGLWRAVTLGRGIQGWLPEDAIAIVPEVPTSLPTRDASHAPEDGARQSSN
jgi:tetratricopeptide (TPR) repeat protein